MSRKRTDGDRKRIVRLAAATAATLCVPLLAPGGPAFAVTGSTFEETDGNLVVNTAGNKDWSSFASPISCAAPFANCAVDLQTGGSDDAFGQGAKDDDTTVQVVTGSIPNNKSDLARFYVADETVGKEVFLYLGWVRNNTIGTANFSIELNQVASTGVPTPGSAYTITRTKDDLLVLFDFAAGGKLDKVELGLSRWVTSGSAKSACQASTRLPCWGKVTDLDAAGLANGSINKNGETDTLYPEPSGGTALPAGTFGEAAVNLTKAGVVSTCTGFGSAMIRSRSSDAFNAELKDFIVPAPVSVAAVTDVSSWNSNGAATTARVFDTRLANPAKDYGPTASSTRTGPGTDEQTAVHPSVDLPEADQPDDGNPLTTERRKGQVVHTGLLAAAAKSVVDASVPITTQSSSAQVAGVNLLDGTVTADVVTALGLTEATSGGAVPGTGFSGLKNLKIDVDGPGGNPPVAMNNVAPNTRVDLSPAAFGPGSYVELRRETLTTTFPAPGTPLGSAVTFAADVAEITMIHLHVTDRTPDSPLADDGDVTTDVVLSSARAHSQSDGTLCRAVQAVEGNATILRTNVGNLAGASIGRVEIPSGGGASHQELEGFTAGNPALATGGVSQSDSRGSWSSTASTAASYARVANLCVDLGGAAGCEITADALTSAVSSNASSASRTSTGAAQFVNLRILGQSVSPSPGVLQEIPGIGLVAVNERSCAVGTLNGDTCTTGDGTRTAMTVRALRIVVNEPLPQPNVLGLQLGSEIVIGEAHSGATFVAVS